jgi:hypothetical protein
MQEIRDPAFDKAWVEPKWLVNKATLQHVFMSQSFFEQSDASEALRRLMEVFHGLAGPGESYLSRLFRGSQMVSDEAAASSTLWRFGPRSCFRSSHLGYQ